MITISLGLGSLPAMAGEPSLPLKEMTVTANKIEENIHKVSQRISVIGETEFKRLTAPLQWNTIHNRGVTKALTKFNPAHRPLNFLCCV